MSDHAEIILKEGFEDDPGFYHEGKLHRGVWLFAEPIAEGPEEPATARIVVVTIPDEVAARYEWLEEKVSQRKFLIPARVLNRYLAAQP